jgi:hypothetical protein
LRPDDEYSGEVQVPNEKLVLIIGFSDILQPVYRYLEFAISWLS